MFLVNNDNHTESIRDVLLNISLFNNILGKTTMTNVTSGHDHLILWIFCRTISKIKDSVVLNEECALV
jgi:hypothetical protein